MAKEKKTKENIEKPEKQRAKKKRFPVGLVILLLIIIAVVVTLVIINNDRHSEVSAYRGTIIDNYYCFYNEAKDEIVKFSLSKGPTVVNNGDVQFAALKSKLKPANNSAQRAEHADEVAKVMGSSFNAAAYTFIDENDNMVLFSYPYNGRASLWLYALKRGTVKMVISDPNVKGIAYGNGIVYARDNSKNETLCYRVATSYSGDLISVQPVQTVTSRPLSYWYMTMIDLIKGVYRGLKASQESA